MTDLHDGSDGLYRPPGLPLPVTVDTILQDFARKLTELNDRSVRLQGQALPLGDPRDIAGQIRGLANLLDILVSWGEGGERTAEAIGAQAIAFLLARARVEDGSPFTGDAA